MRRVTYYLQIQPDILLRTRFSIRKSGCRAIAGSGTEYVVRTSKQMMQRNNSRDSFEFHHELSLKCT